AAVLLSRDDPNLAALDRIDREWKLTQEARMRELDHLVHDTASSFCPPLAQRLAVHCDSADAQREVLDEIIAANTHAADRCARMVAAADAVLARHGCLGDRVEVGRHGITDDHAR